MTGPRIAALLVDAVLLVAVLTFLLLLAASAVHERRRHQREPRPFRDGSDWLEELMREEEARRDELAEHRRRRAELARLEEQLRMPAAIPQRPRERG